MKPLLAVALWVFASAGPVSAAPAFPELTGRVVDGAGMLSAAVERRITQLLAEHERATTNQVVVVTLDHLDGYTIEEFGYQLGRHWGIGQEEVDNGALLIVAARERKVRIEVGYGLEGVLTDAVAATIVHTIVLPEFRLGRFARGIEGGVAAILQAIAGEFQAPPAERRERDSNPFGIIGLLIVVVGFQVIRGLGRGRRGRRRGLFIGGIPGGLGGSRGGGGFGGGFGGGGGGFGGGGASGGW